MKLFLIALAVTGCGIDQQAPPREPERFVSPAALAEIPDTPPLPNSGRVVIDVVGEKAKVFDVTEVTEITTTSQALGYGHVRRPILASQQTMRPLCITPCAADLPQGWHSLVFESTSDPTRTSNADVTVSSQPMAVRHALGHEKPLNGGYLAGVLLIVPSVGTAIAGGGLAAFGNAAGQGASESTSASLVTTGLVLLGVGVALGVTATLLMINNRPERQPGSTTQWTLPRTER